MSYRVSLGRLAGQSITLMLREQAVPIRLREGLGLVLCMRYSTDCHATSITNYPASGYEFLMSRDVSLKGYCKLN